MNAVRSACPDLDDVDSRAVRHMGTAELQRLQSVRDEEKVVEQRKPHLYLRLCKLWLSAQSRATREPSARARARCHSCGCA